MPTSSMFKPKQVRTTMNTSKKVGDAEVKEPMSDERRGTLRKLLLTATFSAPVVTSILAPRRAIGFKGTHAEDKYTDDIPSPP